MTVEPSENRITAVLGGNGAVTGRVGAPVDSLPASGPPRRVQLKRSKGWRMPENTVKVSRPGPFGNPYTIKGAREAGYRGTDAELANMCVEAYRQDWTDALRSANTHPRHPPAPFGRPLFLGPLKGKNLACWCPLIDKDGNPVPCHADVLLKIANP